MVFQKKHLNIVRVRLLKKLNWQRMRFSCRIMNESNFREAFFERETETVLRTGQFAIFNSINKLIPAGIVRDLCVVNQ